MISGYLSFHSDNALNSLNTSLIHGDGNEELDYKTVTHGSFVGSYATHPRLPWNVSDIYYYDEYADVLVLMSGTVYNTDQLICECGFSSVPASPVLVASLFLKYGPDFVAGVNGDFAIFLYRPRKSEAFIFRDHVGVRPVAWSQRSLELVFSSDITGLCRSMSDGRHVPTWYLADYFRYSDLLSTPNPDVQRLLPGHYLHFSERGLRLSQYWHPETVKLNRTLSYEKMISDLNDLVQDAVKIRCDSRFRAGAHISSGLDSGVVSVLARRQYSRSEKYYGFSWSPGDFDAGEVAFDERLLVRLMCEKADIEPVFSDLTPPDLVNSISSLYGNPSLFYEGKTLESAVHTGTNLIFSGWGGDEFISLADRGVEQDLLRRRKFNLFFKRNKLKNFRRFVWNQLHWVIFPALGILDRATKRALSNDARYLKSEYKKSDRKALATFCFFRSRRQVHLNMLRFYHLQGRCEEWMIQGYRRGVEYRYPLLDRRIIEYMLTVPSELLCLPGLFRPILREIVKNILPEEVSLNVGKRDPVSQKYTWKMCKESIPLLAAEVDTWRADPAMGFIDFDILDQDLNKYRADPSVSDDRVLCKGIIYIKSAYEFAKHYEGRAW